VKIVVRLACTGLVALAACGFASAACCQAPPQVRSGYVAYNGARLYYEEAGSGPAIVLIHGGSIDRRMWDPQFAWLARGYRVIRYDARGYGLSRAEGVPFADYEDLRALLDSLHVGRVAVMGMSMGGRIATDFTLANPGRVSALILVAPGLSGFPFHGPEMDAFAAEQRQAYNQGGMPAVNRVFVRWWCVGPTRRRADVDSAVLAAVDTMVAGSGGRWPLERLGRELEPPAWGRLREIRVPTLAVDGSLDMPNILEILDSVATQVPGARQVVIPGAAHMVNMEKPAEIQAVLRPFLAEHLR